MLISPTILKGLQEIYGPTGRKVWLYATDEAVMNYLALRAGEAPPEKHPTRPECTLRGELDLNTGSLVRQRLQERSIDPESKFHRLSNIRPTEALRLLLRIAKWAVVMLFLGVVAVILLASAVCGGSKKS